MTSGIRIASVDDIPEHEGLVVSRDNAGTDDDIAILRDENGTCWALNNTCTHEVASLAEGWVEDGFVECPLHASKFNLKTGEVVGLPATKGVVTHRCEVVDGEIYLYPNEAP